MVLIRLRNRFLFTSMLVLYDYVLLRNREIIHNKQIKLRSYLAGHLDIIDTNLKNIKDIYQSFIESAVKREITTVELEEVSKIAKSKQDLRDAMVFLPNLLAPGNAFNSHTLVRKRTRGRTQGRSEGSGRSQIQNFDLKLLTLNTEYPDIGDHDERHSFFNILAEDEKATKDYQKVVLRVYLTLLAEAVLSNWHYICYTLMIVYTFLNGGFNGFIYSGAIIVFVLVEENLPSIVFWKMCFFNTAIAFWMKLLLNVFIQQLVDAGLTTDDTSKYLQRISNFMFGSASYMFEIMIMIFILIELILIDEMGFKKKKMIDCEDTNESFIRMKINKVFVLHETEKFEKYTLYLKALYEGMKLGSDAGSLKSKSKRSQKKQVSGASKGGVGEPEKDEINIEEVIEYEQKRNNKNTEILRGTIKDIEKNIFIKSFGSITEENKKSFIWQLFTVYVSYRFMQNRKPGIDLSPLMNFILMIILIYTMFFIEQMSGGTQTFADQVVTASIVNLSVICVLVAGISILVIERAIYKKNPKEWRDYFQYKEKKLNHPVTLEELDFCLKTSLKANQPLEAMKFENMHYDENAYKAEKQSLKKGKKIGMSEMVTKKKMDDSHKKNPLLSRYYFLIFFTVTVTFVSWAYLPITYSFLRISDQLFSFDIKHGPFSIKSKSQKTPLYFQDYILFQAFYGLFLIYLVVSALQIKLGEPINKGRRELMSKFNMVYKTVNKVIRVIPFFFTIAITIDFMLTATSLDIWEWFKFESIYEELYKNILEIEGKSSYVPGLRLAKVQKLGVGLVLTFAQIFLLICPFIFFGKFTSEKNKVIFSTLDVALETGSSRSLLYSVRSAKSMNDIDQNTYEKYFNQAISASSSAVSSITQPAVQILSFYDTSTMPFNINLDGLDREVEYLTSAQLNTSLPVKLIFSLTYRQKNSLQSTSSSANLDKVFSTAVTLNATQIKNILLMYSLIRNIGSENEYRTLHKLANFPIEFQADIVRFVDCSSLNCRILEILRFWQTILLPTGKRPKCISSIRSHSTCSRPESSDGCSRARASFLQSGETRSRSVTS